MPDESFREIQLSGKQLIALFMAAAVVLIVAFLSGVLVGRGVRSQREPAISADAAQAAGGAVDPTAPTTSDKPAPQAEPPVQELPPSPPPPQVNEVPSNDAGGPAKLATAAPGAPPGAAADPKPADAGYYVKVAAFRTKADADKLAARLSGKGYAAYVTPVTVKGAALYSLRVGMFRTRQDAEAAKRRLEQEEKLKPSIAR